MKLLKINAHFYFIFIFSVSLSAQTAILSKNDSLEVVSLDFSNQKIITIENERMLDSIKKVELQAQIDDLKTSDNLQKQELLAQLNEINESEKSQIVGKKAKI